MRFLLVLATIPFVLSGCTDPTTDQPDMPSDHLHTPGMNHTSMTHSRGATPAEAGQDAFAAIQEIVSILETDPGTDWENVDIAALQRHLSDMQRVVVEATVTEAPLPDGMQATLSGAPDVLASARRVLPEHAAMTQGHLGWSIEWSDDAVPVLSIHAPADQVAHVQALGFYGWLATGSHHQEHHLALATGKSMH
jgi:hypothetical protein